ncbi:MAG: peroxidase-related enzyme [Acidobacteriaceae bacterium]
MSFLREVQVDGKFGPFVVFEENFGFIPNLLRAQTCLPRVIEAQASLEGAVRLKEGAIPRIQKERILLSVASARNDTYCVNLDSKVLSSLGISECHIDDLLSDYRGAGLSAAEVAMLDFCLKLSRCTPSVAAEDIESIRAYGFGDESIFEAVVTTALAVYRCTLSVGLAPEPSFGPRKLPGATSPSSPEALSGMPLHGVHRGVQKKGPYVHAPYQNPKTFAPYALLYKTHGFIPNFFSAQTLRPDLLAAEVEAVVAILLPEDVLTRLQKECILLAVSAANLNSYCVAMHCNLLRGLGMPSEEGDQIAVDHRESGLSQSDMGLLDFAVKLGTHFSEFSRDDVVKLRTLGFTEEQILECEAVTALNNFANIVQIGLGIEPEFEPPFAYQQNQLYLFPPSVLPITEGSGQRTKAIEDPDAGLVARTQAGDLEAFEELARRHSRMVYRALAAILGNQDEALDAMQDALLSAFKHIGGFRGRSKFSTWLMSIARNAAIQRLRGRRIEESLDESVSEEDREFRPRQVRAWQDNPEQSYSQLESRQLVESGIMALPAKYRIVVMLRDIEQLSTDEVSRQLELTVPTVKVRLHRGRLLLREILSPHFSASAKEPGR